MIVVGGHCIPEVRIQPSREWTWPLRSKRWLFTAACCRADRLPGGGDPTRTVPRGVAEDSTGRSSRATASWPARCHRRCAERGGGIGGQLLGGHLDDDLPTALTALTSEAYGRAAQVRMTGDVFLGFVDGGYTAGHRRGLPCQPSAPTTAPWRGEVEARKAVFVFYLSVIVVGQVYFFVIGVLQR